MRVRIIDQESTMKLLPKFLRTLYVAGACLAVHGVASAHHSYAMFNRDKVVDGDAVVRVFQFTNPHATLWVYINDAQGTPVLWALEAPGPQQLLRNGWGKDTVKPGDKVKVALNPLRNGTNGGSLVKLTLSDGRTLGTGGPGSGAGAPPGGDRGGGPPPAAGSAPKAPQ
jgi:hypothetical protein